MIDPTATGAADLTALAVRAGNLRAGVDAPGAGGGASRYTGAAADRGPAVRMDERTRALADAVAESEASRAQAEGVNSGSGSFSPVHHEKMALAAHAVESLRRQIRDIGETLQIYEETGKVMEVQTTFSTGDVKVVTGWDARALQPWGGAEGYITMLRERQQKFITDALPRAQEHFSFVAAGLPASG
jgi:hypothetical protein